MIVRRPGAFVVLVLVCLCLWAVPAQARQRTQGFCENGGQTVVTAGVTSTTTVQRSYASCTVTVYKTGTTTLAIIYSDDNGTVQANPFTASNVGQWFFYADTGRFDVRFSGTGITAPFTRGDWPSGGMLNISTANNLPLPGNTGALVYQTNGTKSLWLDTGAQWISVTGAVTNVRDFGAHGNGVGNDTTAIQNAVNALPATGGMVFFPTGSYLITASITMRAGIMMAGVGDSSIIAVSGSIDGFTVTGTSGTHATGVVVRDLQFQKVVGSVNTNLAIRSTWVEAMTVERIRVANNGGVWGSFIGCVDCSYTRIMDSTANAMGGTVIYFANSGGVVSTTAGIGNQVIRGRYDRNGTGISMQSQTNFLVDGVTVTAGFSTFAAGINLEVGTLKGVITNSVFMDNNWDGIDFEPVATDYDVTVSNCLVSGQPRGIDLQTGGAMIIGNTIANNTSFGLSPAGGKTSIIVGNTFRGNGLGLALVDGFLSTITSNKFVNNTTAIQFSGTPNSNILVGNVFSGNGTNWAGLSTGNAEAIIDTPATLRGAIVISDAATTGTVNTIGAGDGNYVAMCTVQSTTGAPAAGSKRCSVGTRAAGSFVVTLEAAPGGGNSVTVGWILIR